MCCALDAVTETSDAKTLTLLHVRRRRSKARTIPVWPDKGPVPTEDGTVGTTSTAIATRCKSYRSLAAAVGRVSMEGGAGQEPAAQREY